MIAACERASVRMMVAQVLRFFPQYQSARKRLQENDLGRPAVLRMYRLGFTPQPAGPNWFADRSHSGGVILDMLLHDIDFALWCLGDVSHLSASYLKNDTGSVEGDHALVLLTHKNGAITHLEGSWAFPPPTFRMGFEIACERGLICYDSDRSQALQQYRYKEDPKEHSSDGKPKSKEPEGVPLAPPEPYCVEINAFYEALQTGEPFPIETGEALEALRVALAAEQIAEEGGIISLDSGREG